MKLKFNQLRHLMAYFVREETLDGKDYYVIPSIAIVEGVHNNVLYTDEELKKFPSAWNGVPVTNGHPFKNNQPSQASTPEMIEEYQIGFWYNCVYEDKKLKGEIWLDKEKCAKINKEILTNLEQNIPTDVSTGLFTEDIVEEGEWNGEPYNRIAVNYRPDHLAILPNDVGACSWDDGAGMARLNAQHKISKKTSFNLTINTSLSHSQIRDRIQVAVKEKHNINNKDIYIWIIDVFDDYAVYEVNDNEYYKINYAIEKEEIVLVGEPIEVVREVIYKPKITTNKEESVMEEKIKDLITNASSKWQEADKEFLATLSEEQLDKVIANSVVVEEKKEEPKTNEKTEEKEKKEEPKTNEKTEEKETKENVTFNSAEEFIATAPAEMKEMLSTSLKIHNDKKKELIEKIKSNKSNLFSDDELGAKTLDELNKINSLIKTPVDFSVNGTPKDIKANSENEVPEMPDMEW